MPVRYLEAKMILADRSKRELVVAAHLDPSVRSFPKHESDSEVDLAAAGSSSQSGSDSGSTPSADEKPDDELAWSHTRSARGRLHIADKADYSATQCGRCLPDFDFGFSMEQGVEPKVQGWAVLSLACGVGSLDAIAVPE